MSHRHLSIQQKVYLALGAIFLVIIAVVISVAISSEQKLSREMVHTQLEDKASGYLDTMNMLMVSGAISNRELLRKKILSDDSITEARMLRSPIVDKLYGKGFDHEYPLDDLDKRALAGETTFVERNDENGHTITYVKPVIAEENYRGTNCMLCHQAQRGDILGAVRITYDMKGLDSSIRGNVITMVLIQTSMLLGSLLLLSFLLRKVMLKPIRAMHNTLTVIEKNSDLSHRVTVTSNDEIGQAAIALNAMTQRFSDSLHQVVNTAEQLQDASKYIETSSHHAHDAADHQNEETRKIQEAIKILHTSINQVMDNAEYTTQASQEAKEVAQNGVAKTDAATDTIERMNDAIQTTAGVISSLDERTTNVGGVLEEIKGIAEQTNLLALNAAIEAARAGDSGRGFAVVADEVRTLSQRTHESAQEIEAMIHQLQQEAQQAVTSMQDAQDMAGEGMTRVKETAAALHSMTEHVDNMNKLNCETLHKMQEQVHIGENVSHGIQTISEHSSKTVESAEETTQISGNLVSLANSLTTLVRKFKL